MIYSAISILITIFFFGSVIKALFKDIRFVELLGASFLFGTGIESLLFFKIFSQLDLVTVQIFWWVKIIELFFAIAILVFNKQIPNLVFKPNLKSITSWSGLIWIGIAGLFSLSLIYTLYYPVHTTDSLYYFDFRSKIMFLSHSVSGVSILSNWSYYPMFTSMIGLISRLSGSENPSFYYPWMFLSFALIFYSRLRESLSQNLASLFTFMMYSTPLLYWQSRLDGMTDMPYAIFLGIGFIFAIQYLGTKKENNLYLFYFSILGLALSKWVRIQEPFWLLPLALVCFKMILCKKWWHLLFGLLLFYSIISVWPGYIDSTANTLRGKNTTVSAISALSTFANNTNTISSRLVPVIEIVSTNIYRSLLPISILFLFSLLLLPFIKVDIPQIISLLFIISSWGLFILSTLYSTYIWSWMIELDSSLSRLTSFFVPLIWYYLSTFFPSLLSWWREKKL